MSEITPAAWQWLDTATFRKSVPASSNPSEWTPLYACPAPDVQPVALEKVYETIVQWDEGGGKRSRRELAKQIIDLYPYPPTADVLELVESLRRLEEVASDCDIGYMDNAVRHARRVIEKWEGK
jgi:hypothetical protein